MAEDTEFDLQQFLPYLLNQAAEASSLNFQTVYKKRYGMLRTEWRVLFHLGIYGEMTAVEICQKAQMHKTKISRAVQRLEDQRYLERMRDPDDRRRENLRLTKSGQAVYRDLQAIAADYDRALAEQLDPGELDVLRRALRKLAG